MQQYAGPSRAEYYFHLPGRRFARVELQHCLARLVDCLFPIEGNNADFAGFAAALQAGGYATDPKYAAKLVALNDSVKDVDVA